MLEDFSVFFPSLSMAILWEAGVVARVRSAAQTRRALDTTPASQTSTEMKAKGRSSEGTGGFNGSPKLNPMTPSALAYYGRKMVLTMGSTINFQVRIIRFPSSATLLASSCPSRAE
jgi:hypothetical protein